MQRGVAGPLRYEVSCGDPFPDAPAPGVVRVTLRPGDGATLADVAGGWADGRLLANGIRLETGDSGITGECHPSRPVFERAMRFALQPRLLRDGWLLLHAASAVLDGQGHVFVAPSGTGKSTLLRRLVAAGAEALGDEVALVSLDEVAVFPFQPVSGDPARRVPLHRIHLLKRGGPSSIPVGPATSGARLLANAMVYETSAEAAGIALGCAIRLAESVTILETAVPDDDRAIELLMPRRGRA